MTTNWRIDDGVQTLVLSGDANGIPCVVYWGPTLPRSDSLSEIVAAHRCDVGGGMLDRLPPLSLCPCSGDGIPGQPGVEVSSADGTPLRPRFRFERTEVEVSGLKIIAVDDALNLRYIARIRTETPGLLACTAEIESDWPIRLHWLAAPVLPAPALADEMITFSGRWLSEFQLQHVPWRPGAHLRELRGGRSSHEGFPGAIFPVRSASETAGTVYACHYGWSGGHRMIAEELPDGRRQIQFGHVAGSELAPGTRFETATLYATCSGTGLNGAAVRFQRFVRDRLVPWPNRARPRPVHYNCWEAVYFDHSIEALSEIADRAAAIGAERFVLDDGWFGRRDDDTSSLGDWTVDASKWPEGLDPLIAHVESLGMKFGLWVEPEMVNPDSDLYRNHPDWIMGPADQTLGRFQYVLDLGRDEVRDYLFEALDALLCAYSIDYLKWDHNRLLPYPDAAQVRGVYDLLDRLRAKHPEVEIESCASGGGRIDFGVLSRTHRVWLSDSNDAIERLRIQRDAALFLPACLTGAHVGARVSHSTGRNLPMAFRAGVAASRHLGFEFDLRELDEFETERLARITSWWKTGRDWRMRADIHRLPSTDPGVIAECHVAEDGTRFTAFVGQVSTSPQSLPLPLRLAGLDPDRIYKVALLNPEDAPPQSRGPVALGKRRLLLSGSYLMERGLSLPLAWPATLFIVEGEGVGE